MSLLTQSKKFLIKWNSLFIYDRWYRQKHNISFGSKEHREICQIDIYLQFLEDQLFLEFQKTLEENKEKNELLKKGIWLKEQDEESFNGLFDKMKSNFFKKESQLEFEE